MEGVVVALLRYKMVRDEDMGEVVSITPLGAVGDDASVAPDPEPPEPPADGPSVPREEDPRLPDDLAGYEEAAADVPAGEPVVASAGSDDVRLPDDLAGYEASPTESAVGEPVSDVDDAFSGSLAARILSVLHGQDDEAQTHHETAAHAAIGYEQPVSPGELVARLEDARMRLDAFRAAAARIRGPTNGARHQNGVLEIPRRRGEYGGVVEIPKN